MKRLSRFLKLPLAEKILLLEALLLVTFAAFVLRFVPFRVFRKFLSQRLASEIKNEPADWLEIKRIVRSVNFFSRFVPFTTCLTNSLAAMLLIRSKGQHSVLRIGVVKDGEKDLKAHAWLETNGRIIIGKLSSHQQYTVLDSYFG